MLRPSQYINFEAWFRLINNTPEKMSTDHINGDKLDNRRANLRTVSQIVNMHNRSAQKNSKSGVKGVCFDASRKKWKASLMVGGVQYDLGRFANLSEAKAAYIKKTKELNINQHYYKGV
jgi:hypothetical protein